MNRIIRWALLLACAALAAIGLAACGTTKVKGDEVADEVKTEVLQPRGIQNANVTCPDETEAKKDAKVECKVTADGENGTVTATITNDDGDLGNFKPEVEDIQRKIIEDNATEEGRSKNVTGDVSCPAGTPKDGAVFFCTAKTAGAGTTPLIVTQTSEDGDVSVRVVQRNLTTAKIERQIESVVAKRGITAEAGCPSKVKLDVGSTFECTVRAANGRQITVVATMKDTRGNVNLKVK